MEENITTPDLLTINGGSASGVVAAAAAVRQPELFGSAIIDIPILDMLRFDQFTAGAYWRGEFGSPESEQEFEALYSYSPYHRLEPGTCYPYGASRARAIRARTAPLRR